MNYLTILFGVGLLLELVYLSGNNFFAVLLLFVFGFFVWRKFAGGFNSFIFILAFLVSAAALLAVYKEIIATHFFIIGLSLAFVLIIISFYHKLSEILFRVEEFSSNLYEAGKFLIIFFWFMAYFYGGLGGVFLSNLLSAILLYFLLDDDIDLLGLPHLDDIIRRRLLLILLFGLVLAFFEIILAVNLLMISVGIKAMVLALGYLAIVGLLKNFFFKKSIN